MSKPITAHSPMSFERDPINRGYRIIALAAAVDAIVHSIEGEAQRDDRLMALRHLAEAIQEEAGASVEDLERTEMGARRATKRGGRDG